MNPVVKPVQGGPGLVVFELTEEDRKKMRRISLIDGAGDVAAAMMHQMCVMQMVSMLTAEADKNLGDKLSYENSYAESPVCVSAIITSHMIQLNDETRSVRQRNQLKKLVEDIMNTCPVRRTVRRDGMVVDKRVTSPEYKEAERRRKEILRKIDDYNEEHGKSMPFSKQVELIREAAAVFHVQATTAESTQLATGEVA